MGLMKEEARDWEPKTLAPGQLPHHSSKFPNQSEEPTGFEGATKVTGFENVRPVARFDHH
jgi:hypothetical protein